ncbi:MAG: hypothetical protein E3K36_06380 [Candidatus Brocadia sp.]|nr:hypothetical protein [Candidatus Brocadia sp.]
MLTTIKPDESKEIVQKAEATPEQREAMAEVARLRAGKSKPETVVPTISAEGQRAMSDLAKLKAGIPFSRSYSPQAEIKEPEPPVKPLTFEEQVIADWRANPAIRQEFVSLQNYTAFRKAEAQGRARIHRGVVVR